MQGTTRREVCQENGYNTFERIQCERSELGGSADNIVVYKVN